MHLNYSSNNPWVVRLFVFTFQSLRERTESWGQRPRLASFFAHLSLWASDLTSPSQSFLTCARLFSQCAEKLSHLSESCRNGRCSILKGFFSFHFQVNIQNKLNVFIPQRKGHECRTTFEKNTAPPLFSTHGEGQPVVLSQSFHYSVFCFSIESQKIKNFLIQYLPYGPTGHFRHVQYTQTNDNACVLGVWEGVPCDYQVMRMTQILMNGFWQLTHT